jgi:hypothetical protein
MEGIPYPLIAAKMYLGDTLRDQVRELLWFSTQGSLGVRDLIVGSSALGLKVFPFRGSP